MSCAIFRPETIARDVLQAVRRYAQIVRNAQGSASRRGAAQQSPTERFVARYEKGRPWEGYSDQEVVRRYRANTSHLGDDDFEELASQALARLSSQISTSSNGSCSSKPRSEDRA